MKKIAIYLLYLFYSTAVWSQFAPGANTEGTTAIAKDSNIFINWGHNLIHFSPGPENISDPQSPLASFGDPLNALDIAEGNSYDVVSLGDGGTITIGFEFPIMNGPGPDFAIFENSFTDDYLEFAFVEVSTNGIDFVRFPSISNIPNATQTGPFGSSDPSLVHNLAGKYQQGYGTPFDLNDLIDSINIKLDSINFIKLVDVVGSIDPAFGTYDSQGQIVNDPFPNNFNSAGFDLDAIGVIYQNNPLNRAEFSLKTASVYPNPARQAFTIYSEQDGKFELFDYRGQLVLEGKCNEIVNTDMLTNGMYIIRFFNGSNFETLQLAVMH